MSKLEEYVAPEQEYEEEYFTQTGYQGYQDYPHHAIRVDKIISIANPRSVLDVGCAYGYIVKRLLDKGIDAYGMDISHWCEKQAANIIPGHYVRHDMRITPYPFKEKQFDLAYCEGVLEHIRDSAVEDIMAEFERISHKRILALTFDWHERVVSHIPGKPVANGHINLHDTDWWFERMPEHSWLFLPPTGTQGGNRWLYKC